jgi:NitT/TauT family transport system substrate-binding protein
MKNVSVLAAGLLALSISTAAHAETIRIAIGHQSMCTDTYTGGIVVKELHLLQKYLPHTGKYAGVHYDIVWDDYSSGGPITNQMLADKLNFGVMGDYPLIVNGAKFQATRSLRTVYVAGTGYNLFGSGNGIDVPVKSNIYSFSQLKGKSVSTPIGSASWGMLINALQQHHMSLGDIQLKNQAPVVGAANIAAGKIDAHADFCPWSEIMQYRGTGRKILDGSQVGVPYLHGVVVREDFVKKYPEVVVAFIEAMVDAGKWIDADPLKAVRLIQKWTGVEKEVLYLYFSKGGYLTLDPTIKPAWIKALKEDHAVLAKAHLSPPLNFKSWIDDSFVKQAYAKLGLNYKAQEATVINPSTANKGLPNEIWVAGKGITTYPTMDGFLKAVAADKSAGTKLNATYVYDRKSGLKMFGKTAFYVKSGTGAYSAFLLKGDADTYAGKVKGHVLSFAQAWGGAGT